MLRRRWRLIDFHMLRGPRSHAITSKSALNRGRRRARSTDLWSGKGWVWKKGRGKKGQTSPRLESFKDCDLTRDPFCVAAVRIPSPKNPPNPYTQKPTDVAVWGP